MNNSAGLGFNGYDDKGNAKWDLLNNVKIYELEVCIIRSFVLPVKKHAIVFQYLNDENYTHFYLLVLNAILII